MGRVVDNPPSIITVGGVIMPTYSSQKQLESKLRKAIIKGLQRNGDRIFDVSQRTEECYVPVDTGMLKKSGYKKNISKGFEIGYVTPYAADVEYGHNGKPAVTRTVTGGGYWRKSYKTKSGKIVPAKYIPTYTMQVTGKRLVQVQPKIDCIPHGPRIWVWIDDTKPREGQYFLTRATMVGIKDLVKDIEFYVSKV